MKNALTKSLDDPTLGEMPVVPTDRMQTTNTEAETGKPILDLIAEGLENRPELLETDIDLANRQISRKAERNALLPTLSLVGFYGGSGLAGLVPPGVTTSSTAPTDLTGAWQTAFNNSSPDYFVGLNLNIPFRNRAAQADYVTDELQLRQTELQLQRLVNQVGVEVKNAVIGLRQARTRYETAVNTRTLGQQNLEAQQNMFKYGAVPDATLVIQAQKDLAADQTAELQAMANYTHARIAFDEAVGQTLDMNHISMQEATAGKVERHSVLPGDIAR